MTWRLGGCVGAALWGFSCATASPPPKTPAPGPTAPAATTESQPATASAVGTSSPITEPLPTLRLREAHDLTLPGVESALRLVHAPLDVSGALIYLHGKCGEIQKLDSWAFELSARVTVIALRGAVACGSGRTRWEADVVAIHGRIQAALAAVKTLRGGQLATERVTLFGYSQGANRAERLSERFPDVYPWVILGGPPGAPQPSRLANTRGVAVFGGSREPTAHMRRGVAALLAGGLRARFDLLLDGGHGEYVPGTARLLLSDLEWLHDGAGPPRDALKAL